MDKVFSLRLSEGIWIERGEGVTWPLFNGFSWEDMYTLERKFSRLI